MLLWITAKQFKFDVDLYSKFGPDFPKQYLSENKINFDNCESDTKTTKFAIKYYWCRSYIKLENECAPIEYSGNRC